MKSEIQYIDLQKLPNGAYYDELSRRMVVKNGVMWEVRNEVTGHPYFIGPTLVTAKDHLIELNQIMGRRIITASLKKLAAGEYQYTGEVRGKKIVADVSLLDDGKSFGYLIKVDSEIVENDGCYGWTLKGAKEVLLSVITKVEIGDL